jgi:ABC-type branched-subunit amino acid transport system substrate-binding protein
MASRSRFHRATVVAAAAAALAVGIAACGGGDDGEEGGAPADGGPIKVGLLVDLTGELGSFGKPWQQVMEMARDEINEVGGLPGGGKLETIVEDGETDTQASVQAARKMIDAQDVSAILGPSSGPMVALSPLAKRAQVTLMSAAAGTVELNQLGGDFVYRTVASDDSDGRAIAKFLNEEGAQDVGLLIQNEESTLSPAAVFKQDYTEGGGTIAAEVTYNPKQSSYRSEIQRVLGANPKWIVCACGQQSGVTIIRQAHAAGYTGDWLVTADIITPEAIEAVGADIMEGVYGEVPSADESLEAFKRVAADWKERTGDEMYPYNANAYDAMIITALAMVAADGTSGSDINEHLREVSGPPGKQVSTYAEGIEALKAGEEIDYEGASGPVNLDDTGSASSPYAIQQVTDGEWKQVKFYAADEFAAGG